MYINRNQNLQHTQQCAKNLNRTMSKEINMIFDEAKLGKLVGVDSAKVGVTFSRELSLNPQCFSQLLVNSGGFCRWIELSDGFCGQLWL